MFSESTVVSMVADTWREILLLVIFVALRIHIVARSFPLLSLLQKRLKVHHQALRLGLPNAIGSHHHMSNCKALGAFRDLVCQAAHLRPSIEKSIRSPRATKNRTRRCK